MNTNSYKYFIFKDKNVVVEILKGRFDLSEYINLKQSQFGDADYTPDLNVILDIRNIKDNLSEKEIKAYTEGIKPVQPFADRIKAAVITDSPSQVTGAMLYKLFENKAIDCEVFSTLEYAFNWLGISESDFKDFYDKFD